MVHRINEKWLTSGFSEMLTPDLRKLTSFKVPLLPSFLTPRWTALLSSWKCSKKTGANFTGGFRRTSLAVFIDVERLIPSAPGNTSVTRANLLSCRRTDSSISHTRSIIFRIRSPSLAPFDRTFHLVDATSPSCSKSSDFLLQPLYASFGSRCLWLNLASRVLLPQLVSIGSVWLQVLLSLQDHHSQVLRLKH